MSSWNEDLPTGSVTHRLVTPLARPHSRVTSRRSGGRSRSCTPPSRSVRVCTLVPRSVRYGRCFPPSRARPPTSVLRTSSGPPLADITSVLRCILHPLVHVVLCRGYHMPAVASLACPPWAYSSEETGCGLRTPPAVAAAPCTSQTYSELAPAHFLHLVHCEQGGRFR